MLLSFIHELGISNNMCTVITHWYSEYLSINRLSDRTGTSSENDPARKKSPNIVNNGIFSCAATVNQHFKLHTSGVQKSDTVPYMRLILLKKSTTCTATQSLRSSPSGSTTIVFKSKPSLKQNTCARFGEHALIFNHQVLTKKACPPSVYILTVVTVMSLSQCE